MASSFFALKTWRIMEKDILKGEIVMKFTWRILGVTVAVSVAIGVSMGVTYFITKGTVDLADKILNVKTKQKPKMMKFDDSNVIYVFE